MEERNHYPGQANNWFAFALGQAERYEAFLHIILARYHETTAAFLAAQKPTGGLMAAAGPGPREMTPEEIAVYRQRLILAPQLQLDSESFYLFAKILLDRLAKFLESYFRPSHSEKALARGFSFNSHDELSKRFESFAQARGLEVPSTLLPLINDLKSKISDFRDYQISHNPDLHVSHAMMWSITEGKPRMAKVSGVLRAGSKRKVATRQVESIPLDSR